MFAPTHGVPCTCTRLRRRSEARSCTDNLFVLTRILQEAEANKTVYAFFHVDVKRMRYGLEDGYPSC
jgi:hypothetical protein